MPRTFNLERNYPNPFSPATVIRYELPQAAHVLLAVYNLLGEKIRSLVDSREPAGITQVTWDGRNELGQRVTSEVTCISTASKPASSR